MKTVLYFQSPLKTSGQKKLEGIREVAAKLGWHVQVIEMRPTCRDIRELTDFWQPAGAIAECAGWGNGAPDDRVFAGLPHVYLDAPSGSLPDGAFSVSHDSRLTGRAAARALLETGRTEFAYVAFPSSLAWSDERRDGFRDALKINGRDCHVLESVCGRRNPLAFQRRLSRFLSSLPRPAAVFAANDATAETVLSEIRRLGFRVPEDFAVLGVDNYEPICEHAALSSVEPDFRSGGRIALLMLAAVVRDGAAFHGERLRRYGPLRVVTRASTRTPSTAADGDVATALDLIHREACNGLSAEAVLATFPCSRTLAAARFRRTTGGSVLNEIHRVQLARAMELLRDPNRQIKSISDFCGFANPNSLKKLFRRETGQTMSMWRISEASFRSSSCASTRRSPSTARRSPQRSRRTVISSTADAHFA